MEVNESEGGGAQGPLGYFGCLPDEMLEHIFSFLSLHAKVQMMASCKTFYQVRQRLFYPLAPSLTTHHHRFLKIKDLARVVRIHKAKTFDNWNKARRTIPLQGRQLSRSYLSPQGKLCLLVFESGCSLYNLSHHELPIFTHHRSPRHVHFDPHGRCVVLLQLLETYKMTILWLSPKQHCIINVRHITIPCATGPPCRAPFLETAFLSQTKNALLIPT